MCIIGRRDTAIALKSASTYVDSELADRDTAIALKSASTYVDSELAERDTAIALKSDLAYVDSELDDIDTAIALKSASTYVDSELAARDTAIALKSASTYVDSELAERDTAIALKSDLSYVDAELDDLDIAVAGKASSSSVTAIDTRLEQIERVVVQDAGKSYHYLQAGEDALIVQGPTVSAFGVLGSSAGALEGKVLVYKDVQIGGSLTMGALSGGITTGSLTVDGSSLTTLLAAKASSSAVSAVATRVTDVERIVTVESENSYNYLEAGAAALVIRGPNEVAANFLGSSAGAQEGKALFYKDVSIGGSLTMGALSGGITTGSLTVDGSTLTDLMAAKENAFTAVLPLKKGYNR